MTNLSDIIESFLIETLGDQASLCLNRNELANYFSVAPSQINYVLSTRFTPERGFIIESKRGGGGSITVTRIAYDIDSEMNEYLSAFDAGVSYRKAAQIIDRLREGDVITKNEGELIKSAISDKALIAPTVIKDKLRGSIMKSVILQIMKQATDGQE